MNDRTTAPAVDLSEADALGPRTRLGLSEGAWLRIGLIVLLMGGVFWPALRRLWYLTAPYFGDPNWQHSFFVPAIGLYYLYLNREALLKAPVQPMLWGRFLRPARLGMALGMAGLGALGWWMSRGANVYVETLGQGLVIYGGLVLLLDWGLGTTLLGLLLYGYGIYPGQNDFVQHVALVITIFGLTLLLAGWPVMKVVWFPIVFLLCAIPWPPLVYSKIAMPLQELAASSAAATLRWTGVEAARVGTKLYMGTGINQRVLNVAEACAGLKSLMTFVTLAGAIGFLSSRPLWQKIIITVSAIPIAIFCNMIRVSGQGLLDHYVSQQLSQSFAHQFVGLVMLIPAVFLLQFVALILDHLFIEEVDKRGLESRAGSGGVIEVARPGEVPAAASDAGGSADDLVAATRRLMSTASARRARPPRATHQEEKRS